MKKRTGLAMVLMAILAIIIGGCISVKFKDEEAASGKEIKPDIKIQVKNALVERGVDSKINVKKAKQLYAPILKICTDARKYQDDSIELRKKIRDLEFQLQAQIEANKKLDGNMKDVGRAILKVPGLPSWAKSLLRGLMQRNMGGKLEE